MRIMLSVTIEHTLRGWFDVTRKSVTIGYKLIFVTVSFF